MDESMLMQQEIWQKQREAEARVRRMREENRRLAAERAAPPPLCAAPKQSVGGGWLPLLLALVMLREGAPTPLVLALLYLAL